MKDINVPNNEPNALLDQLAGMLTDLTPEIRKAAAYVLDNPNDVGVSSVREIAQAANVTPNTMPTKAAHAPTPATSMIRKRRSMRSDIQPSGYCNTKAPT